MHYLPSYNSEGRTGSYRFSVDMKEDLNVTELKKSVAAHNKAARSYVRNGGTHPTTILRVSLMARGTRRDDTGRLLHPNADSSLQHQYADYFDVYVHDDYSSMYNLNREMELGMTPGELRKYDELQYAPIRFRMEIAARKWKEDNK